MDRVLFSVVIPAHNAARTLAQTLESVLIQRCRSFEIIVIDDGSTDGTGDVARRAADGVRLVRQEQSGVSAARNLGIEVAVAPWVSFLDADDLWLPSYLTEMEAAIQADPTISLFYTDAWVYDESAGRVRRDSMMARARPQGNIPTDPSAFLSALLGENFVHTATTVSREALLAVGGFASELTHAEDYDLWLRLAAAGRRARFVGGPLAVYRIGGTNSSLSSSRAAMVESELRVLSRLLQAGLSPTQKAIARARIEQLRAKADLLSKGEIDTRSVPVRVRDKVRRLRRGTLYRRPPAELREAFPALFDPQRLPRCRA